MHKLIFNMQLKHKRLSDEQRLAYLRETMRHLHCALNDDLDRAARLHCVSEAEDVIRILENDLGIAVIRKEVRKNRIKRFITKRHTDIFCAILTTLAATRHSWQLAVWVAGVSLLVFLAMWQREKIV